MIEVLSRDAMFSGNGIKVHKSYSIAFTLGGSRHHYLDFANKFRAFSPQIAGRFHDLAGRGTSHKEAELSRQKRHGWQVCDMDTTISKS